MEAREENQHAVALGRRSRLTPTLQKQICNLLAQGNTIKTICDSVGIGQRTYYDWLATHPQFSQATSRARGKARIKLVKVLVDASKIDWRAAAWLLSHCWPSEFSETRDEPLGLQPSMPPPEIHYHYRATMETNGDCK